MSDFLFPASRLVKEARENPDNGEGIAVCNHLLQYEAYDMIQVYMYKKNNVHICVLVGELLVLPCLTCLCVCTCMCVHACICV